MSILWPSFVESIKKTVFRSMLVGTQEEIVFDEMLSFMMMLAISSVAIPFFSPHLNTGNRSLSSVVVSGEATFLKTIT
jgi:cell division septal protein FtsQ